MTEPRYVGLQKDQIRVLTLDDKKVIVNAIAGNWDGSDAPIKPLTDVILSSVTFKPGGKLRRNVAAHRSVFFYVVRGETIVNGKRVSARHIVEFNDDGEEITVEALTDAIVLFRHAKPNREPIAARGPFVMNTEKEIMQAMQDYRAGKFGDWQY